MDNKQTSKKSSKKSVTSSDKNNNKTGNKKKKKNRKSANKSDQKDSDQSPDILEIEGLGALDNTQGNFQSFLKTHACLEHVYGALSHLFVCLFCFFFILLLALYLHDCI